MLTMTLMDFSLACQIGRTAARLPCRCAWRGSSDLAHRCGRVPLFICTNIAKNSVDDRGITDQYSGGDREMRPKQEILLGVGSCRAIEVLLLEPPIFPRVKITRERRRLAAALDCVHIIPPLRNVAFAQRAAYCQGWYGEWPGHGRVRGIGQTGFHGSILLGQV